MVDVIMTHNNKKKLYQFMYGKSIHTQLFFGHGNAIPNISIALIVLFVKPILFWYSYQYNNELPVRKSRNQSKIGLSFRMWIWIWLEFTSCTWRCTSKVTKCKQKFHKNCWTLLIPRKNCFSTEHEGILKLSHVTSMITGIRKFLKYFAPYIMYIMDHNGNVKWRINDTILNMMDIAKQFTCKRYYPRSCYGRNV